MKLLLQSSPDFFVEEDKIITTLFEEGLDAMHLRKPDSEPVYCERLLTLLPETSRRRIVTADHFYLKNEFDLMGIHLSRRNPTPPQSYRGQISYSCYSIEDLERIREDKRCQYVVLNNVFNSISISRPGEATLSMDELHEASRRGLINKHVMAHSGISMENIRVARDLGFGGVVVCNDIWKRFNIHSGIDYKELISHFHKLRKAAE